MRDDDCPMCDKPITGPGYLVDGTRKHPGSRRWTPVRFLICHGCLTAAYDPDRGVLLSGDAQMRDRVRWFSIVGRGDLMPATPCTACERPVIRRADPLLKRVTCSAACSTSLTRTRNGNKGSGQPCETCGKPITEGRADSRTCSPACRQKAYRQRKTAETRTPVTAVKAPPLLDARGRRFPQRSQRKSLEAGIAHLSGLCGGFARTGKLEGPVDVDELTRWRAVLADAERTVEALHLKLLSRSGVADEPIETGSARTHPVRQKNLASGTAVLSGLCMGFAGFKALDDEITPELATQWQVQVAEALAGIRNVRGVLQDYSHAQA